MSTVLSHSDVSILFNSPTLLMPAQFMSMSTGPSVSRTLAAPSRTCEWTD